MDRVGGGMIEERRLMSRCGMPLFLFLVVRCEG